MKILCTGDLHIGRRSSRLPHGVDSRAHSSTEAWFRIVDLAVAEQVALVTVSGDLVDVANRFFEAFGPIEAGISRLADAGIEVALVAGNHDFDVLPRIVDALRLDNVRLLGRWGRWERMTVERGGDRVHLDGWSFPTHRVEVSPLASYAPRGDGAPVLALAHGDLDQPRSVYAPIAIPELRRHPGTLFALGHLHTPRTIAEPGGARAVYPGSPQALDPAEPGPHGVCLVDLEGSDFRISSRPLSSVRYDRLEVDVAPVERLEDVEGRIVAAVRDRAAALAAAEPHLGHFRCRVRLTGATAHHRALDDGFTARVRELEIDTGRPSASVERVEVGTRPARDLEALSRIQGPPGVLARLLLSLDNGNLDEAQHRLLLRVARAVQDVHTAPPYLEIAEASAGPAVDEVGLRRELEEVAGRLLEQLLTQREDAA